MSLDLMYPIIIVEDRYSGVYSRGNWIAVAEFNKKADNNSTRLDIILLEANGGNGDSDFFWRNPKSPPPHWVAVGNTPNEALENLRKNEVEKDTK